MLYVSTNIDQLTVESKPGKDYSIVQSKFWMAKFLSSWKEYIKIEPFSLSLSLSLSLFSNILSYKVVIFHNFKAKHDPSYSVEDFKHFYIERARNNINIERNLLYLLWKKKEENMHNWIYQIGIRWSHRELLVSCYLCVVLSVRLRLSLSLPFKEHKYHPTFLKMTDICRRKGNHK